MLGRRWRAGAAARDPRLVRALVQRLDVPDIIAEVLANRGIDLEAAEGFLNPRLRDLLPDPSRFRDMDRAAALVAGCIRAGRPVGILGDYDVDGATSTSLLTRFIRAAGGDTVWHIPDRITEGYGPNLPALEKLHAAGAGAIITVDCGTTAFDVLDAAAAQDIRLVVLDHHLAEDRLPAVEAVVNPNRLDCESGHGYLAAVGMAFMLAVAVNRELRRVGWFGADRREPDLMGLLDLVALGTVCDVVPLVGLNRALVAQGLKVMGQRRALGMTTLADIARVSGPPGTYAAGFQLGPRINAGGRVGKADLGTRLLTTDDPDEARGIAEELDRLNAERQRIEAAVLEEALVRADRLDNRAVAVVADTGWHPGVIGIVAGRLKDRLHRPAFVVSLENGIGKGSGRSVSGVDLGAAVTAARQAGLLVNGGGHAMAAGITVAEDRLEDFTAFMEERLAPQVAAARLDASLSIDGAVAVQGITTDLAARLGEAGPWGAGNPEPRLAIADARLVKADIVGESHVRVILSGKAGGRASAIAFRSTDTPLGAALLGASRNGMPMHLAGHLRLDHWRGEARASFIIEDAAQAGG
ncbi:MAG: single-stranded-DNA-specific exonuclease RecJ [Pseudomonadota bacterium]|nr:single-stranded-DNA-specific exonuclease RecJ [Pseudomonadota bacterium]